MDNISRLSKEVDRLVRAISIPGSKVTVADIDAANEALDKERARVAAMTPAFDYIGFIIRFEEGELESEEELIEGFQALIDNGMAWTLQGTYGRTAMALIEAGHCHHKE